MGRTVECFEKAQNKKEIPHYGGRFTVPVEGNDVHKDVLLVAIVKLKGTINLCEVPNTDGGANDLANLLARYHVRDAAMESTAEY